MGLSDLLALKTHRMVKDIIPENLQNVSNTITQLNNDLTLLDSTKASKDEVTNVLTPKGNSLYAALPTTGNEIGHYYYCSDGNGVDGAGNYVWNGTVWYFGGTGDEGYNILKNEVSNNMESANENIIDITDVSLTGSLVSNSQRSFVENPIKKGYKVDNITIVGTADGQILVELWTNSYGVLTQVYSQSHIITLGDNVIALNYVAVAETYVSIKRVGTSAIARVGTKTGINYFLHADALSTTLNTSEFNQISNTNLPLIITTTSFVYALDRAKDALAKYENISEDVDTNYYKLEKNKVYTSWDESNKVLTIYKNCTEKSSYLGYNFQHEIGVKNPADVTTWYDAWRLKAVFLYNKNSDGTFTKSFPYVLVHDASEWECAIKETGQVDFVGGSIHGDEIVENIVFMLDGIGYTNVSDLDGKVGYDLRIFRTSSLYRCNTLNVTKIANHYVDYNFSVSGITISQRVKWIVSTTCDKSYLTMLGAKRLSSTYQITAKAIKEGEGILYDVSVDGFTNDALIPLVGSKKAYLYNDKANLKTAMSVEILESNRADNSTLFIQNTVNYNKVYFSFCENGYPVTEGDEWKNKSLYKLDYFGMIS